MFGWFTLHINIISDSPVGISASLITEAGMTTRTHTVSTKSMDMFYNHIRRKVLDVFNFQTDTTASHQLPGAQLLTSQQKTITDPDMHCHIRSICDCTYLVLLVCQCKLFFSPAKLSLAVVTGYSMSFFGIVQRSLSDCGDRTVISL